MKILWAYRKHLRTAATALAIATLYGSVSRSTAEWGGSDWLVLSGPETSMPTDCVVLKLGLYTYLGEESVPPVDTGVTVTDLSPGAGAFFADPSCLEPLISEVVLPEGTHSVEIYYRNQAATYVNVQIEATDFPGLGWESYSLPGAPTYVSIDWPTPSQPAATCTGPFHLEAYDEQGNPVPFDGSTEHDFALTYTLGDARFYSDSACTGGNEIGTLTIPAGETRTTEFYFQGTIESEVVLQTDVEGFDNHIGWNPSSETVM